MSRHRPPASDRSGDPGAIAGGTCDWRSGAIDRARMLPSRKSASASRAASSGDFPASISSRHRSSRCCDSSSTTSASRAGESWSVDSRSRMRGAQSGMSCSMDPAGVDTCHGQILRAERESVQRRLGKTRSRGFRLQPEGCGCPAIRTFHPSFRLKPEATQDNYRNAGAAPSRHSQTLAKPRGSIPRIGVGACQP